MSKSEKKYGDHLKLKKLNSIIKKNNCEKSALISTLLDIQSEYNYLPKEALIMVAKEMDIPLNQIYSVATFYKVFSLQPRGEHIINVCLGTACHVRGGGRIIDEIRRELKLKDNGGTTEDMKFTLEPVRCLGCCASGPVIVVDNEYHSQVTPKNVNKILKKYSDGRKVKKIIGSQDKNA
ncbi:MAG: NADH-quinone oxidoreductase subunit NuoE [Thermoplasmata archaeon]|nr:MAG: NADH-quinone oxidoreductase subunit NuoE [Thermoplasmata archaeon]